MRAVFKDGHQLLGQEGRMLEAGAVEERGDDEFDVRDDELDGAELI